MLPGSGAIQLGFFVNFVAMTTPAIFSTFRIYAACLFVALTSITFLGCQGDTVCEEATTTSLRMGFYTLTSEEQATATSIDSLTIFGLNRPEDRIYDNQRDVARIELPLNPSIDSTAFVFIFPENTDTLWFGYSRIPHLVSVDCGFTLFFEMESMEHTNHHIITGAIDINLVSNTLDEHIKLIITDTTNGL